MNESPTKQALALEKQGDLTEAAQMLLAHVKSVPNDTEALLHLARITARGNHFEIALKCQQAVMSQGTTYQDIAPSTLPKETLLFPHLGWFQINLGDLHHRLIKEGIFSVFVPIDINNRQTLSDLTPENCQHYYYQDIDLYQASLYGTCIILEKGAAEIDPSNPHDWKAIQTQMEYMAHYTDYMIKFIKFYQPRKIVYPQGYIYFASILRQLAITRGIPLLAIENTMHKDKILHDSISGISVNKNTVRNLYWRYKDFIPDEKAKEFTDSYFANILSLKQGEHSAPATAFENTSNDDKKTVLYLAQVGTDASVLFGLSHKFKNQADVIALVTKKVIESGHRVIIKLHPKEKHGDNPFTYQPYNQLTLRWLQKHPDFAPYINHKDVIIDGDNAYNTYDMIEQADLCVTINSQSGLESLLKGKNVILCGHSFFGGMGWTQDAQNKEDLEYALEKMLALPQDEKPSTPDMEVMKLFYCYLNHACINRRMDEIVKLFAR